MIRPLIILLALTALSGAADYTLPAANQGQWVPGTNVGVSGGINQYRPGGASARGAEGGGTTIDVTASPYNADDTGASDASTAIQSAITAAVSGDLVWIPAGTYRCNSAINLYHDKDGVTIRGAGPGVTIIDARASTGIGLGQGAVFTDSVRTVTGTGGTPGSYPKGATVLNVADTTDYAAGYLAKIYIQDETDNTRIDAGAAPTFSTYGFTNSRGHYD